MHLYNLTLQPNNHITKALSGNFTGTKEQQIILAKNSSLELIKIVAGLVKSIYYKSAFGIIRSITKIRLISSTKDLIAIGSDSGRIVLLEYDLGTNEFVKVHQETFGKSGVRRGVPGQYICADPTGRAIMIGAMEKTKFAYILNRDAEQNVTISSPLECQKSNTICSDLTALSVGFENPMFCSLEVDYSESDVDPSSKAYTEIEKMLVFHELDLGLNHVVRKKAVAVSMTSNFLLPLPGATEGPGGLLVFSEGYFTWCHEHYDHILMKLPTRNDTFSRGDRLVSCGVVHQSKNGFFCIVGTEDGDLFKITVDYEGSGATRRGENEIGPVSNIRVKYFDTVAQATSLVLLKSGFLFVASEFGNHCLYQVENLSDGDEQAEFKSLDYSEGRKFEYLPRALKNISITDEIESLSPLIDSVVANLTDDDSPQIYCLSGRGARSSFRILRHGLEVTEVAVSDLPGTPNAVWTCRGSSKDEYDSYIMISFVNATLVLSVGETVQEVTDTGILVSTPTLCIGQLGEDALLQIYPEGIRHIRAEKRVSEWKVPPGTKIIKGTSNHKQVAIALSSNEIIYFEVDQSGNLNEFSDRKDVGSSITSIAMSPIPTGRQRATFLAVGCEDNTVRLLSLDPKNCLESVSVQALSAPAESLALVEMIDDESRFLYLYMGLQNGVFLCTTIDHLTGLLSDVRQRFLGTKPVQLFPIKLGGTSAVLALSTKPWVSFTYQSRTKLIPLSYEGLGHACSFRSEECEGIVGVVGDSLRVLSIDKLSSVFNQVSVSLKYTPRRMILHESKFVILESENQSLCESDKVKALDALDTGDGNIQEVGDPLIFGYPKGKPGSWASCIRFLSPLSGETLSLFELDNNEAAVSLTTCLFAEHSHETLLVVGCSVELKLRPREFKHGLLKVYRFANSGNRLEFLHQNFARNIIKIHTQGDRIIASDAAESNQFAMYRHFDNRIVIFADDPVQKWMTCSAILDYNTVIGGDKFGTIFVNRLDAEIAKAIAEDTTGNTAVYDRGFLQGAPHKLTTIASFFVGESISGVHKTQLIPGGRDVLLYTTFLGTIGVLIPFSSKADIDFYQMLEITLRQELQTICGSNHMMFRGSFSPVRGVVDGDLCELFNVLEPSQKRQIAGTFDRSVTDVSRKLDELRSRGAI